MAREFVAERGYGMTADEILAMPPDLDGAGQLRKVRENDKFFRFLYDQYLS